jgi:hypothetical protein
VAGFKQATAAQECRRSFHSLANSVTGQRPLRPALPNTFVLLSRVATRYNEPGHRRLGLDRYFQTLKARTLRTQVRRES